MFRSLFSKPRPTSSSWGTGAPVNRTRIGSAPGRWPGRRTPIRMSSGQPLPPARLYDPHQRRALQHAVVQAAFSAFITWVTDGTPPPTPDPFALSSMDPVTLALDEHGNVIGGVRTPAVDVPVSTLSGSAPPGASALCALFGSTEPFSDSTLSVPKDDKETYLPRPLRCEPRRRHRGGIRARRGPR